LIVQAARIGGRARKEPLSCRGSRPFASWYKPAGWRIGVLHPGFFPEGTSSTHPTSPRDAGERTRCSLENSMTLAMKNHKMFNCFSERGTLTILQLMPCRNAGLPGLGDATTIDSRLSLNVRWCW